MGPPLESSANANVEEHNEERRSSKRQRKSVPQEGTSSKDVAEEGSPGAIHSRPLRAGHDPVEAQRDGDGNQDREGRPGHQSNLGNNSPTRHYDRVGCEREVDQLPGTENRNGESDRVLNVEEHRNGSKRKSLQDPIRSDEVGEDNEREDDVDRIHDGEGMDGYKSDTVEGTGEAQQGRSNLEAEEGASSENIDGSRIARARPAWMIFLAENREKASESAPSSQSWLLAK